MSLRRVAVLLFFPIFFILPLLAAFGQSSLPPKVQADILQNQLVEEVREKKFSDALVTIDRYKALGVPVPLRVLWLEAKLAYSSSQAQRALKAIELYLSRAAEGGKEDELYAEAIALYPKIQKAASEENIKLGLDESKLPKELQGAMLLIKGGCFEMGDTSGGGGGDERPVHAVCVGDFFLGIAEVTQAQWQSVMGTNPSNFKGPDRPVENVSWLDVQEFIQKLNERAGGAYRLPTEAEWEYAARSRGQNQKYAGTNQDTELEQFAWFKANSGDSTHPVMQKRPNGLGLYDMTGNVWEWVQDWYDGGYYKNSPKENPKGPASGEDRVLRGGSWDDNPGYLRAASRHRGQAG
ncbi:MAG: formylglycine-generating enzyme family protein [Candidatus Manganitrophaceae bacterium]